MKLFLVVFTAFILSLAYGSMTFLSDTIGKTVSYHRSYTVNDVPPICHTVPPALWCSCKTLAETCGNANACEKFAHYSWNEPIHITLLYESLCPDCQRFITEELYPTVYSTPLRQLVRIELVPFGNARQEKNGTIVCQHGEKECQINKYQSCAIHYIEDPVPFVFCLESLIEEGKELEDAARKCYESLHTIPHIYDQVVHCAKGDLGTKLQAQAAARTEAAWPDKHQFVPWVYFNNVSISNQQFLFNDLPQTVCQFYIGDEHKEHCAGVRSHSRSDSISHGKRRSHSGGCARNW